MKVSNEFKIGIATIIAIIVLVLGIQWLKGINTLHQGSFYYIECTNTDGLAISSHVKVNGFTVGQVRAMAYDYKKTGSVIVTINTDASLKIPRDSKVEIAPDLLGTADVTIALGSSTEIYQPYDTLAGGDMAPGMLDSATPIMQQILTLMPKLDTLISGMNVLVKESKMQETLLEINTLSNHLNTTVNELNRLLRKDVPELLHTANSAVADIDTIANQVKEADVARLLTEATQTLEQCNTVLQQLQSPDNSAGKLLNTSELHDQLSTTILSVDSLVTDIKAHPKRYINIRIFGRDKRD